jgi:hypothetical protein
MHPRDLEGLGRSELIERAEALGVDKANLLTKAELADEIVRRSVVDPVERRIARGLLGLARDLVARVVERGLHLPETAALIRGTERPSWTPAKPPIATVTLAEIYAAQGHRTRALSVLDEVLETEADHAAARALRDEIAATTGDEPAVAPEPDEPPPIEGTPVADIGSSEAAFAPSEAPAAAESAPIGMVDDVPLPERYDVDEVVLMPVDPKTIFLYWEVRERTADLARKRTPGGRLIVRIVAVTANWEGPRVETRDIEVDELVGDRFVRDLPSGAVLRAAVGWSMKTDFEPLSVAMEMTAPPAGVASVGAGELARFEAEGIVPEPAGEGGPAGPGDEALAQAVERARRRIASDAAVETGTSSSWPALPASPWSGPEGEPEGAPGNTSEQAPREEVHA